MSLHLGPVKPHVQAVAEDISRRFGITNIGGFATVGHIANSDHYLGLAIDVMINSPEQGQQVATYAVQNAQALSITYVIWNKAIWDSRNHRGWERYSGSSPHTDHVHISFFPKATGAGVEAVQGDSATGSTPTDLSGCLGLLTSIFTKGNST